MMYTILKIKDDYSNGKPLFIGSPAMVEVGGSSYPHYVTNIHNAGCFTKEELNEALRELPLFSGAFEFIYDINEYLEQQKTK